MDRTQAVALERILEALIAAGEGEAFMAAVRRIEANGERRVRINVNPPLDDADEMTFDAATYPVRFRRIA